MRLFQWRVHLEQADDAPPTVTVADVFGRQHGLYLDVDDVTARFDDGSVVHLSRWGAGFRLQLEWQPPREERNR